jgi:hypothetical protein
MIPLPLDEIVPPPELFAHPSTLHGQAHVARVMVHAFRLLEATGHQAEAPRLWAAVYLHDIARTHDGTCHRHGADAVTRLKTLPEVRALFARGGVQEADYPAIETAVTYHCISGELKPSHEHWLLASLLKDADGLDRVRLGDLDPRYLRHRESLSMLDFAEWLYQETDGTVPVGRRHFAELWGRAANYLPWQAGEAST